MTERVKPESNEAIPKPYDRGQWAPVGYTTEEGGAWTRIEAGRESPPNYSSLQYRNGWIFDNVLLQLNVNPWRHADDTNSRLTPDDEDQGKLES